jgi:hypothetical protein
MNDDDDDNDDTHSLGRLNPKSSGLGPSGRGLGRPFCLGSSGCALCARCRPSVLLRPSQRVMQRRFHEFEELDREVLFRRGGPLLACAFSAPNDVRGIQPDTWLGAAHTLYQLRSRPRRPIACGPVVTAAADFSVWLDRASVSPCCIMQLRRAVTAASTCRPKLPAKTCATSSRHWPAYCRCPPPATLASARRGIPRMDHSRPFGFAPAARTLLVDSLAGGRRTTQRSSSSAGSRSKATLTR